MLINKSDSSLLIIDIQERLAPVMAEPRRVIDGCARLIQAAKILAIPFIVTEQYPQGLGGTLFDVKNVTPQDAFFTKTSLSAVSQEGFLEKIKAFGKKQVIIAGIEAHICVFQTAVELKQNGFEVFVVCDASGSRMIENEKIAFDRLNLEGIPVVCIEMVFFEWLRKAGSTEFKEIQKHLIR